MKRILITIITLFITTGGVLGSSQQEIDNATWSQSYEKYRADFKPLPKKETIECERKLKEILNDLDTKNRCEVDDECTLLEQDPFGNTVPILKKEAVEMQSKITKYNNMCVDQLNKFVPNSELVHLPVCYKNKCMVKTKSKD